MASVVGGLAGIAEKSAGEALAFGLGFALGRALEPAGVGLSQTAWDIAPDKVLDPGSAAAIVAEDVAEQPWGEKEARQTGIDPGRFDRLVKEALNAPGLGELLTLLRREDIDRAQFVHGLRKSKLETLWDVPLEALLNDRLDPSTIATAIQRGVMHDPGVLVVGPPSAVGKVPPMPTVALDTLKEAAAHGMNEERLAVLARLVGLPASPDLAARMVFRGLIDRVDFDRAIAEGNTRNEWAPFLFEAFREILNSHDYIEGHLRGWIDAPAMYAGTAKHGLSRADTDLRFQNLGRPLAVHQIATGLARGGTYGGDYTGVPEPYNKALRESNVRPEWGNLAYANRYTLPGAFVLRALAQGGDLTHDETHTLLLESGWPPDLALKVAARWTEGTAAKADPHTVKAQNQLWTALHKSYVDGETTTAEAHTELTAIGVLPAAQPDVLRVWDHERDVIRRSLTPAQIKKAFGETKFTRAEALARLEKLGMNAADAATLLDE